jgi:hypothetical protein
MIRPSFSFMRMAQGVFRASARVLALGCTFGAALGCAHGATPDGASSASSVAAVRTPGASASASSSAAPGSSAAPSAASGVTASTSADASGAPASGSNGVASATSAGDGGLAPALEGADFTAQARRLFRVAACGAAEELPARFDASVVAHHCDELGHAYDEYKKSWLEVAEPFLASLRPKTLPDVVVYPFGGGDLVSALATFPEASEITTISLEPAGDVRPVDQLAPERLGRELAAHRAHLERLFEKAHSRTDNLEKEAQAEFPGEIVFALGALVVHGDEPVSLRYFRLGPDGAVNYVSQADLDAAAHHPKALRALFDNAELRFRKSGQPNAPVQILRHIAFNLDDAHLKADPSLLAHLSAKGKVAAMTKAASHLLWNDHFTQIRDWLVGHTDWMVSDSTGIPPRYAQPAGYSQDTYGTFDGPAPFGLYDDRDANDFKRLFASEPSRELAFRYGYPDRDGHAHLIVTRR